MVAAPIPARADRTIRVGRGMASPDDDAAAADDDDADDAVLDDEESETELFEEPAEDVCMVASGLEDSEVGEDGAMILINKLDMAQIESCVGDTKKMVDNGWFGGARSWRSVDDSCRRVLEAEDRSLGAFS